MRSSGRDAVLKCPTIKCGPQTGWEGVFLMHRSSIISGESFSSVCSPELPRPHACVCSVIPDSFQPFGPLACQAPLPMEFSRQEYRSGLQLPPPGDLPESGIEPARPVSCIAGVFLTTWLSEEAQSS